MSERALAKVQTQQKMPRGLSSQSSLLRRACACSQHTIAGGECSTCRNERSTLLHSQRAPGGPPLAPFAVQGDSPAQENVPSLNSAFNSAFRFGHDFSRIPVYSSHSPVLQTKLTVNQPGDVYERETDRRTYAKEKQDHFYVPIAVNESEGTIDLRNPWGTEDLKKLPLTTFRLLFDVYTITYTTAPDTKALQK